MLALICFIVNHHHRAAGGSPQKRSGKRRALGRAGCGLEGRDTPGAEGSPGASSAGSGARSGGRCGLCSRNAPNFINLRISPHTQRPPRRGCRSRAVGTALTAGSELCPAPEPRRDPAEPPPTGAGCRGRSPAAASPSRPRARAAPADPFVVPKPRTNEERPREPQSSAANRAAALKEPRCGGESPAPRGSGSEGREGGQGCPVPAVGAGREPCPRVAAHRGEGIGERASTYGAGAARSRSGAAPGWPVLRAVGRAQDNGREEGAGAGGRRGGAGTARRRSAPPRLA